MLEKIDQADLQYLMILCSEIINDSHYKSENDSGLKILLHKLRRHTYYTKSSEKYHTTSSTTTDDLTLPKGYLLDLDEITQEDESIHLDAMKLQRDPEDSDLWNRLGNTLAEKEYYVEAIACFGRVTHLNPDNILAWYNRGLSLSNLGKYEEAVRSYDRVLEIDPDSVYARNGKGSVLSNLGKYEEAVRSYDRVLEIDPNNTDALNAKGLALERLHQYDESVKSYDRVLEIDPNNTAAWYYKGSTLFNIDKYSEAEECYNRVYELDQHNVSALVALRQLYSNYTYQFVKSLEISQKLLEIEPSPQRRIMVAEDYIKTGNYKKGRQLALEAKKEVPWEKIKHQCIIRLLIILSSYLLEGDSVKVDRELVDYIDYYEVLVNFKIDENEWSFNGLIYLIDNKADAPNTKAILFDLIDSLQGKKDKSKVLANLIKIFANRNVGHGIFKWRR